MTVLAFRRDRRERVWAWERRAGMALVILGSLGWIAAAVAAVVSR